MTYQDPSFIRAKPLRLYFNEHELKELNLAIGIHGGQRAEVLRGHALNWARNVIASAHSHEIARQQLGLVTLDGDIKYRFVA